MHVSVIQNERTVLLDWTCKLLFVWFGGGYLCQLLAKSLRKCTLAYNLFFRQTAAQNKKNLLVTYELLQIKKHWFFRKTARLPFVLEPCAHRSMPATCVLMGSVPSVLWSSRAHAQWSSTRGPRHQRSSVGRPPARSAGRAQEEGGARCATVLRLFRSKVYNSKLVCDGGLWGRILKP